MRKFIVLITACVTCLISAAQLQVGLFGGISNYQGDLVDKLYQKPKAAFGFTLGYQLTTRINLRAGLTFAKVSGADSLNTKQENLRLRNLSFESPITEFSIIGEFNTFDLDIKTWSPYVFGGLAVYHFNPYTMDQNGNKVFLQPLSTEGQGLPGYSPSKPYALTQIAIPFGGGIKYNASDNVRLSFEIGLRKLFSDYLDDVSGNYADPNDLLAAKGQRAVDFSYRGDEVAGGNPAYPAKGEQRGSPKYKDYYYFTGLHLTFLLPEGNRGSGGAARADKKGGYGCPTVF
ncbi:MAG: DUF6089 family protein [Flavisolibacter sp.]